VIAGADRSCKSTAPPAPEDARFPSKAMLVRAGAPPLKYAAPPLTAALPTKVTWTREALLPEAYRPPPYQIVAFRASPAVMISPSSIVAPLTPFSVTT